MRIVGIIVLFFDGVCFVDFWFFIGGRLLGGVLVELVGIEFCFDICFGFFGIGVVFVFFVVVVVCVVVDFMGMVILNYCSIWESVVLMI